MKKLLSFIVALSFCALPVHAEDKKTEAAPASSPSISIGVIDVMRLVSQSDAGKSISSQLEARAKSLQSEAASLEKSLMAEEQALVAEQAKTKPADFEPKRKAFESKVSSTRASLLKKNQALETARANALSEFKSISLVSVQISLIKKNYALLLTAHPL